MSIQFEFRKHSFKDLDSFVSDRSNFVTLKQQKPSKILNRAKKNPNINFNIFEKFYFFCIRKLESRKKNIINY